MGPTAAKKPFTVNVKTPDGKKIAIKGLSPDDPVKKLKRKIEEKTKIPRKKQVLTDKKKKPLERDSKPIKQYGVKNGDTLDVKPVGKKPMTIYVKTPSGKKVTIKNVKPSDTVSKIKKAGGEGDKHPCKEAGSARQAQQAEGLDA